MNFMQGLYAIFLPITPVVTRVFDAAPNPVPTGPYAVVTDMRADPANRFDYDDTTAVVLITLYGGEGMRRSDLFSLYDAVKALKHTVNQHPGVPHLAGVSLGPCLPPTQEENVKRPYAGIRFNLRYLE